MFGRPRDTDALARTRVRVGGCPCAASVALMERIDGLQAAAAMHRAGSLRGEHSVAEHTAHLDAEDGGPDASGTGGGLFRLMEAAAARPGVPDATRRRVTAEMAVLRGDHQRWRVGLGMGLAPPPMELAVHAAIEDRIAVDLKDGILAEAAARGILRAAPGDAPGDARHATAGALVGADADERILARLPRRRWHAPATARPTYLRDAVGVGGPIPSFEVTTDRHIDFGSAAGGLGLGFVGTGPEKFMDPMFECFGQGISGPAVADDSMFPREGAVPPYSIFVGNAFGLPTDVGLSYLGAVPNTSRARVAAIRARMGATPPSMVDFKSSAASKLGGALAAIAEASFKNISRISSSLIGAYADARGYEDIAATFSIPVAQVRAQAEGVAEAARTSLQAEFVELTARYQPIAATIATAVGLAVKGASLSTGEAVRLVGGALAAAVGNMVPVIGAAIVMETDAIVAWLEQRKKDADDAKKLWYYALQTMAADTSAEMFPIPWHALDDLDVGGFGPEDAKDARTDAAGVVRDAYENNLLVFRALSAADADHVRRWWTTASALASHPGVLHAMARLGHGVALPGFSPARPSSEITYTGLYSGQLASDEQVMLVALPIAIANGIDPDVFARQLWAFSKGWRDADPISIRSRPDGWHRFGGLGDFDEDGSAPPADRLACPGIVTNAWWLNWAVLARDALDLASRTAAERERAAWAAEEAAGAGARVGIGIGIVAAAVAAGAYYL